MIAFDLDGTLAQSKSPLDTEMAELLTSLLCIVKVAVNLGGTTSIDITKPGIDKGYGIRKLRDTLGIAVSEMVFVGDAIFPGGNDYPAKQAGALTICVRDPEETKRVVEAIIACLSDMPTANVTEVSHA
jgi:phosphomannomutase